MARDSDSSQIPTPPSLLSIKPGAFHLRLLIEELRVNSRAEIQPTYRIVTPTVCAMSEKVEAAGIEPAQDARRGPLR